LKLRQGGEEAEHNRTMPLDSRIHSPLSRSFPDLLDRQLVEVDRTAADLIRDFRR
jgi:hypothetical protein